jgi:hypothetical protein
MNSPATTAISLTNFFNANPRSSPPKNPPPIADTGVKRSLLRPSSPGDVMSQNGCTWYILNVSSI